MAGMTARLGNAAALLGRIVLGQAPDNLDRQADFLPFVVLEFSPSTGPMGAAVWVDITDALVSFTTSRGRHHELDRTETGKCTLILASDDRRFDPLNAEGPWYGQLAPNKRIRIRAVWDGVDYPVFTGYVEEWTVPLWRPGPVQTKVTAVDGFGLLSEVDVYGNYPEQATGARINDVLTEAGWSTGQPWVLGDAVYGVLGTTTITAPLGDRSISTGVSRIAAQDLDAVDALSHIQLAAQVEAGLVFVSAGGAVTFQARHERIIPQGLKATFGNDTGQLPYVDCDIDASDERMFNHVSVTRVGGQAQVVTDTASIAAYFKHSYSARLPLTSDDEAHGYANWVLQRSKDFRVRLSAVMIDPPGAPATLWPHALGRELSDKIRIVYAPPTGSTIDETSFIERIEHRYSARDAAWTTTFGISPATEPSPWVLEDPTFGVLGVTTRPIF